MSLRAVFTRTSSAFGWSATASFRWFLVPIVWICLLLQAQANENVPTTGSVVVLPVKGPVTEAGFFFLRRAVKDAEAVAAAGIILDMDTPGGDLKATEKIVQMLTKSPIPSFTYVNTNAGSAGALIALGT